MMRCFILTACLLICRIEYDTAFFINAQAKVYPRAWHDKRNEWLNPVSESMGRDSNLISRTLLLQKYKSIGWDIFTTNLFINRYDVYVRRKNWAEVSIDSWWNNVQRGFLTDGDAFGTNWFGHPFHGALFYNAARLHGASFYSAIPYTLAGSLMWEFFGETEPPSEIDAFTTPLGGLYLGEVTYRLSDYLWNHPGSRTSPVLRSVMATVINPTAALHRYVFDHPIPKSAQTLQPVQVQLLTGSSVPTGFSGRKTNAFMVQADIEYGDKLVRGSSSFMPFDVFDMRIWLELNEDEGGQLRPYFNLMSQARILSTKVLNEAGHTQVVSLSQHYDFIHNDVFKIGSVVVTGDWDMFWKLDAYALAASARLGLVLFGSGNSEQVTPVYPDIFPYFERDYIYGQGYVGEVECAAALGRVGSISASLHHFVIYSRSEPTGRENLSLGRFRYLVPLSARISAGLQYDYYFRNAGYYLTKGYVSRQNGQKEVKLVVGYVL